MSKKFNPKAHFFLLMQKLSKSQKKKQAIEILRVREQTPFQRSLQKCLYKLIFKRLRTFKFSNKDTMKPIFLLFFLSLLTYTAQSQIKHTLTIYSEIDEPFTFIVNGEQMSEGYVTRLEFETFNNYYQNGVIKFENEALPNITNKLIHISGDGKPTATVYKIYKREKKKKGQVVTIYKLGYVSSSEKSVHTQTVIINNTTEKRDGITIEKGNTKVRIGR